MIWGTMWEGNDFRNEDMRVEINISLVPLHNIER